MFATTTVVTIGLALACHADTATDKPLAIGAVHIDKDGITVGETASRRTPSGWRVALEHDGLSVGDDKSKAMTRVRARGLEEQSEAGTVDVEDGVVMVTGSAAHVMIEANNDPAGGTVFAGSAVASLYGANGRLAEVSLISYQGSDQTLAAVMAGAREAAVTISGHGRQSGELVVDDKPARVELKQHD